MRKPVQIPIRDSEKLSNVLIQVDLEKSTTTVLSSFSAWENLALILEALALTAQKCKDDGIPEGKVDEAIREYFAKAFNSYNGNS